MKNTIFKILYVLFFIVGTTIFYVNGINLVNKGVILYILISILFFGIITFIIFKNNIKPKYFLIFLFLLSFFIKVIFVFIVKVNQISDFNLLYETAVEVSQGNFYTMHNGPYFINWSYQSAFVLWLSFFIKIFGNHVIIFKLMNCIVMSFNTVLIYLIAKNFADEKSSQSVSTLYVFFPALYFYVPVITNQHLCVFFLFSGFYIFINQLKNCNYNRRKFFLVFISGLLISFGNAMRPIGIIVVFSILFGTLLFSWFHNKYEVQLFSLKKIVVLLFVLIVTYFISTWSMSFLVAESGINKGGLKNNFPIWKFVEGLNYESNGTYTYKDDLAIFKLNVPPNKEKAKEMLNERISIGLPKLMTLFGNKISLMWSGDDVTDFTFYQYKHKEYNLPILGHFTFKDANKVFTLGSNSYYLVISFLWCVSILCFILNNKKNLTFLILSIMSISYFIAHLLIEIQTRYRYFMIFIIFIMASKGIEVIVNKVKKLNTNNS